MIERPQNRFLAVYLVADPDQTTGDLSATVIEAIEGGVTAVQFRSKLQTDRDAFAVADRLAVICRDHGVTFIVNDRVDIALAVGADGVHVGVDDLPVEIVRRLIGPRAIVGYSPESEEHVRTAPAKGVDYLGIGPVFASSSKDDAPAPIGIDGIHRITRMVSIPVVGIGGITAERAAAVVNAGAAGVAVIGAILRSPNPADVAKSLRDAVEQAYAISSL